MRTTQKTNLNRWGRIQSGHYSWLGFTISISIMCAGLARYVVALIEKWSQSLSLSGRIFEREGNVALTSLLDQTPLPYYELDPDGLIRQVNASACRLLGYDAEELVGFPVFAFIAEIERAESVEAFHKRCVSAAPLEPWVNRFVCRNGELLWLESHEVFLYARDRLSSIRGALIDITSRKQALEAQHEGELAHRRQFAANFAVMLLIDPSDGVIIDANLAALSFYGYPRERIVGMEITMLSALPSVGVLQALSSATQGKGAMIEFQHRLADGSVRDVEMSVSRVQLGPRAFLHAIVHDISKRKQAQQALLQSEALQRHLLGNLPAGVVIMDPATRVIELANAHASTLFGVAADQMVGRCWHSMLCPICDASSTACDLANPVDASGQTIVRSDGTCLPILKTVKRIQLDGREKLLECFIDLSKYRQSENALQESERRYRQLFDGSRDAMFTADPPSWKFTAANQSACEMFGVANVAAFKKLGLWDVSPECQPGGSLSSAQALAMSQEALLIGSASREWVHRRLNGTEFPATVLLTRMEMNGLPYLQATVRDITIQKRAEAALRESEEKHRLLIENSHDIIYTMTPGGVLTFVSPAWTVLLGHPVAEVIGQPLRTFLHPDDQAMAAMKAQSVLDTRQRQDGFEYRMRHLDGSWRWHTTGAVALLDPDGLVVGIEGNARDITGRKLAEDALKASEARLRAITDSALDAIIMQDCTGRIIFWNPAAESIFGYNREEAVGGNLLKLLAPDRYRESLEAAFREFIRTGISRTPGKSQELIACHKNGNEISVELMLSAIDRGGERHALGIVRDITARRQVEWDLTNSREQHALVIEGCDEGVWDWDIRNDTHYRSQRWCQMIGYRPEEFPATEAAFVEHIHPDDQQRVMEEFHRYLSNEIPNYCLEYRLRHKNGDYIWINARGAALRDERGIAYRIAGSHSDITRRKQDEDRLAESAARLTLAARAGGVGIWDWEIPNDRLVWDDQMLRLYGITREQFKNPYSGWLAGVHSDDRVRADNEIQTALRGGGDFDTEFRVVWPDSSVHSIRAMALVSRDAAGKPLNMIGTNWDITSQKIAADKLHETNRCLEEATARANRMAERAEVANTAKSEFLANMSHEIRTPMNGVIGMTGLLLDTDLNPEQRHYAEIVRGSGQLLLGIINDILDFSKIEAGKLDLEIDDFDLETSLDDFADTVAVPAFEKGLELLSSADLNVPTALRGDSGRLRQVLANLVGNAIKFTSAGEVVLTVSLLERTDTDCLLRFSVRDTGIGIAQEKIGLLFTKFTQVDASTTRNYGGTGLGLAISKQLAALMGGEIGVESAFGRGSEFWFTARFQTQPQRRSNLPPEHLSDVRVLLACGNAESRRILNTRMTSWGMRCAEAGDLQSALQTLNRAMEDLDPFQLAVIAPRLPAMDGESLAAAIQADPRLAGTRMVLLSIPGTGGRLRQRVDLGFSGSLMKPVRSAELMDVLSSALLPRSAAGPASKPTHRRYQPREMIELLAGRNARILLAEDNITNQQVAVAILKKFGLRADAVANGAEAVEALKTVPYDLVLMDVQMPIMSGLEATILVRNPHSEVRDHAIPIVAMTAHSMQGDRQRCLDAGMDDYLSKPVSFQSLAATLAHWLPVGPVESNIASREENPAHAFHTVFDRAGMLERMMNDEDLAREITACFLEDMPKQIEALRKYLDASEASGVERQAHTIKGASSNVGGEALREVAAGMEQDSKRGNLTSVAQRMGDLEYEFVRLKDAMKI